MGEIPAWVSVLCGTCGLIVGAVGPWALLGGRLARLEARADGHDRTATGLGTTLAAIQADQGRSLALLYKLAGKRDVEV